MLKTRFLRNKDIIPLPMLDEITIIGLGGIGSFVAQYLTIMGFKNIIGYDNDIVEAHNLSSTAYPLDSVGDTKVEAMSLLHKQYSEDWQTFEGRKKEWTSSDTLGHYTIVCTDDMESRKMVYKKFKDLSNTRFLIDARMGATTVELVTTTKYDDSYVEHWVPTNSVPPAPCSMKHTLFATTTIASFVTSQVQNLIANNLYYDYIWCDLSPININFGSLINPNQTEVSIDTSEHNQDGLESNTVRSDLFLHRSTENRQDNSL